MKWEEVREHQNREEKDKQGESLWRRGLIGGPGNEKTPNRKGFMKIDRRLLGVQDGTVGAKEPPKRKKSAKEPGS